MSGEMLTEMFSQKMAGMFDLVEEGEAAEIALAVEKMVMASGDADIDDILSDCDSDFDSAVLMGGWINLWGNDQLRKKVLRRGKQNNKPDQGSICVVNMVGCLQDGTTFDDYEPLSLQVGDTEVILGIDVVLMSMDVGEKSLVEISPNLGYGTLGRVPDVPPNQVLIYLLELISSKPEPDISKYTTEQLQKIGTRKRDRGNWWYSRQEHMLALGCYERSLCYLGVESSRPCTSSSTDCKVTEKVEEDPLLEDRLKVYNNMAAIHLKMENYSVALEEISYVVARQPNNVKALFRKGKILGSLGQLTDALDVLSRALELDPTNNAVRMQINIILGEMKAESQQARHLYRKMFGGFESEPSTSKSKLNAKTISATTTMAASTSKTSTMTERPVKKASLAPATATASASAPSTSTSSKPPKVVNRRRSGSGWGAFLVATMTAAAAGVVVYRYKNHMF